MYRFTLCTLNIFEYTICELLSYLNRNITFKEVNKSIIYKTVHHKVILLQLHFSHNKSAIGRWAVEDLENLWFLHQLSNTSYTSYQILLTQHFSFMRPSSPFCCLHGPLLCHPILKILKTPLTDCPCIVAHM